MDWFNFTKSVNVDLYHDSNTPSNEPKMKGYFIALLVKPDLNLPDPSLFAKAGHNIDTGSKFRNYNVNVQHGKLFRGIMNELVYNNLTHNSTNHFSSIIANRIESISYPDIGSNSEDTLVTLDKAIFKLPVTETGSSGMTFVMKLRENEGLDCLRMMTTWHRYIHAITKGNIYPKNEYLDFNIIDYKGSLYILHLKPDFRTITMCTKYTGIYPTNIPVSAFSEELNSVQDVSLDVEFTYDKFELIHEDLIKEINLLSTGVKITREILRNSSDYTLQTRTSPFKGIKLIDKIKDTPFYHIDLNGLNRLVLGKSFDISKHPASLFGHINHDKNGSTLLPAARNIEQIDLSSGRNILGTYGDKKYIESRK